MNMFSFDAELSDSALNELRLTRRPHSVLGLIRQSGEREGFC